MSYVIVYHETVVKEDIMKLGTETKRQIRQAIEEKLANHPELFGKPLRQSLKGYRKLRVGDYRVIFRIEKSIVKVLIIEHRSRVYNDVDKRK